MRTFQATSAQPGPDGNMAGARLFEVELRDVQAVGRPYRFLEGRAVPYDAFADIGWFVEAHRFGSFERSTKGNAGRELPLLLFHDNRNWPAGRAESWTHEADGMHGVWRLNDTTDAQTAATLAASGDLIGLSIGFQPIRSEWELLDENEWNPDLGLDHKDRVTRLESRLLEVSMTPTPAFKEAKVTAIREQSVYTRAARSVLLGDTDKDRWLREVDRLRG
jgi:HK97 family phage prohead protease